MNTFSPRILAPLMAAALLALGAHGQVPSPKDFLGYAPGEAFTPHYRVVDYFEHVATASSQVRLVRYGATYEGRPLLYAIISAPENMGRLEEIRTSNLLRSGLLDAAEGTSPTDEAVPPAIVWLSYNVHGNESVSTEAAIATLYALTDTSHTSVQDWLTRTVVIIDPCVNPDGRDRYVHFYQRTRGHIPDVVPEAREHQEPWPGGRTNHYYFDLNRDWAWGTQAETQQRLPQYQKWMPHIHVDFHEQSVDAPYFFAPAAEPYHDAVTPWQRELQQLMGENHASYFDARGWLFFTRQIFDLFYPGYGDTWPTFNGALGMTYEQGGSGRAGLGIVTAEGDTLTLRERLEHHYTTGLSTIEVAATHRERIVREFADFFRPTVGSGSFASFVVKGNNADKMQALARHLTMQGITFGSVAKTQPVRGFAYRTGSETSVTVAPGDMVISTNQPRHVLTRVLFEPVSALSDSLSYDITAWALPYIYGTDAYALEKALAPDAPWAPAPRAALTAVDRPVAYLAEWRSFADAQLLAQLLASRINVRFAEKSFSIGDRHYGRGTLILARGPNSHLGKAFDEAVVAVSEVVQQPLIPVTSTMVTSGIDFGSGDVPFLKPPRVAIVGGSATSAYGLGELWHYFDQQLRYKATVVNAEDLARLHLFDFDVIILPSGSYSRVLPEATLNRIKVWVEAGGRLVAIESAAGFLAGKDGFSLQERDEDEKDDKAQGAADGDKEGNDVDDGDDAPPDRRLYGERARDGITESVTGAIFRVDMDTSHPLAFGYDDPYFTLKRRSQAFELLEDDWNVGILKDDARVSGFVGAKARQPLANSLVFGVQAKGHGEVVYLLDNPLFRGFWYNGRLLMANAVFLVGQRSVSSF